MKRTTNSFDGGTVLETPIQRPDKYRLLAQVGAGPFIARGAGLSYTAASFGAGSTSIDLRCFNRFLGYEDGVLHVEAGVTLGQVYAFLLAHGAYVPVQPGHPDITVGGCVAADVHGKNPLRDGTFASLVTELELYHPTHGVQVLSPTQNAALFALTCGGYGLTGVITRVRVRTAPLPSTHVEMRTIPLASVEELPATLASLTDSADLLYSWHDFMRPGAAFGRGFLKAATFVPADGVGATQPDPHPTRTLFAERRGRMPWSFFSPWRTTLFNQLFYHMNVLERPLRTLPLYDFLFPVHDKEVYFDLFGRRGFHECQCIIPVDAFTDWVREVKAFLSQHRVAVTLASGKLFGGERTLLRFTGAGVCMALNFPRTDTSPQFAAFLHDLAVRTGAIPNLNKDSLLSAHTVAACYPEYDAFRTRLHAYDPARLFRSDLSERLHL